MTAMPLPGDLTPCNRCGQTYSLGPHSGRAESGGRDSHEYEPCPDCYNCSPWGGGCEDHT